MWNLFSLLAFENLQPMNKAVLIPALNFLWKGLLAIFVVIGLIILSVKLTTFFVKKAEEAKAAKENQNDGSETPSGN
jgi:hypothetical protein